MICSMRDTVNSKALPKFVEHIEPVLTFKEREKVLGNLQIVNEYFPLHISEYSKLLSCIGLSSNSPKDKYHFEQNRLTVSFELRN